MKKSIVILFVAGFTFGSVIAEVPTKPSYTNSGLASEKTKDELNTNLNKEEIHPNEASRGMLNAPDSENSKDEKINVLKKTKAGRLTESNKHLDK